MKDDITIDGTNAPLSQQEEDTSTATKLYRTQDAATLAGIQSPQLRNARKRFMKLADRLNLKPADERRCERGGGSLEKFWTLEQIQAVKAEHQRTAKPKNLDDRANNIRRLQADMQRKAIEIGKELNAAKAEMPHGNWANWLEENFQWSERTAQYFMNIAKRFGNNPEFAELKTSTLRALLDLPEGTEQDFINVQATIGKPVKDQSERELKAAIKQQKKRKKNPTPVTVDTPPPQIDSEPVNHINTNDKDGKSERAFVFEGDKTRDDAILQGYNTPCQDPATQPADALTTQEVDSETITTSGDNSATDSPADETADALIDSELADIFALINAITDADKLRRIQAHISERLAEIDGKKISLQTPASR